MDDLQHGAHAADTDINLDDDDDMFKSARGLEPEPEKRDGNLFGTATTNGMSKVAVDTPTTNELRASESNDRESEDREISLEDEDEQPFQVNLQSSIQ